MQFSAYNTSLLTLLQDTPMDQELEQFAAIYEQVTTFLVNYSFQLIGAIVVFLIGVLVARRVSNFVLSLCERKGLDVTLSGFIANTTRLTIIVMTAIIALGKLEISITPFVAAVGALSWGWPRHARLAV